MKKLIITRHVSTANYLADKYFGRAEYDKGINKVVLFDLNGEVEDAIDVVPHASEDYVKSLAYDARHTGGLCLFGVIPLKLAKYARKVIAVEFEKSPRGKDLSIDEMEDAGVKISCYRVRSAECPECGSFNTSTLHKDSIGKYVECSDCDAIIS